MQWNRWMAGALAALALAGLAHVTRAHELSFANLEEAKARLLSAGFRCTSDNASGKVVTGFLVSKEGLAWNDAAVLCKIGKMGPKWKGKAWVTMSSPAWQLQTVPDEAGLRGWGGVLVFGDQDLLDELDRVLQ